MQEKNRNTLLRALRELPDHEPPDQLWSEMSDRLDREQAEAPLRKAISELPDHYPPAELWENLSDHLEQSQAESALHQAIAELPTYEPPSLVWEGIEAELTPTEEKVVPQRKIIPMWRRPAIAAGFTALVCAMAWWLLSAPGGETVNISYATMEVMNTDTDEEQRRDEEAFQIVLGERAVQVALQMDPEMQILKEELVELDAAREQLLVAMSYYGRDAEMEQQMTKIEHERSNVLKEIITKI